MVDLNPVDLVKTFVHGVTSNPNLSLEHLANPVIGVKGSPGNVVNVEGGGKDSNTTATTTAATKPAADPTIQKAASTTAGPESSAEQGLTQQLQQINPLAMQLFAQQVLQPWMTQLGQMTQQANKQYGQAEQQIASEPFMKGNAAAQTMLAQVPQEQLGGTNLVNAYLGAAAATPEISLQQQAMSQIQQLLAQDIAQRQKLASYYDPTYQAIASQAQTAAGGLGSIPGLGAGIPGLTQPAPTQPTQQTTTGG